MRLIKILITLFFLLGSMLFVAFQIITFSLGISSKKRRFEREIKFLRSQIKDYVNGLIPLDSAELELLSVKPIAKTSRKRLSKVTKGYLSSIYQEPLFAFAFRKMKLSEGLLLLVRSKNDEYFFLHKGANTQIWKNEEKIGKINQHGELFNISDGALLARINESADELYKIIQKNGRELAHVRKVKEYDSPSSRAIPILEPLDSVEEEDLVPLILYDLILKPEMANG